MQRFWAPGQTGPPSACVTVHTWSTYRHGSSNSNSRGSDGLDGGEVFGVGSSIATVARLLTLRVEYVMPGSSSSSGSRAAAAGQHSIIGASQQQQTASQHHHHHRHHRHHHNFIKTIIITTPLRSKKQQEKGYNKSSPSLRLVD